MPSNHARRDSKNGQLFIYSSLGVMVLVASPKTRSSVLALLALRATLALTPSDLLSSSRYEEVTMTRTAVEFLLLVLTAVSLAAVV